MFHVHSNGIHKGTPTFQKYIFTPNNVSRNINKSLLDHHNFTFFQYTSVDKMNYVKIETQKSHE